jgi:hypothetical protein
MRTLWIAAALVPAGLAVACGPDTHAVPPKAPNTQLIVGDYERHPPEGTTAIRLRGDGSVRVAKSKAELDSDPPIAAGTWTIDGNKLTLVYAQGACTSNEGEKTGVYNVVISRVGIHFTKVEDSCTRRAGIDGQTWWRIGGTQ